jgi:hypothetical protein
MPPTFTRGVAFLLVAGLLWLPACERRSAAVVAPEPLYTETGALSLCESNSYRQAQGTYDPMTGRFVSERTTTQYYIVQLLDGQYLTVTNMERVDGIPNREAGLQDHVHALMGASETQFLDDTEPISYASDSTCFPNEWFEAHPHLEYRWADSSLLIWTAPASPFPWRVATLGVPHPAVQLTFDKN